MEFNDTKWWQELMHGIHGPRQGGARIIIDAEDSSTGTGKTSLAVYLARRLSKKFDYDLEKDDLTLSGAKYLERWREHPGREQPSVIILDELGGAGAGHARRAMSTQNVELGNAWQVMRKKRIVSIVTLPHWSKVDKDMRRQADYRLWCLRRPIGFFRPFRVGSSFDDGSLATYGYSDVQRIGFPDMDKHGDPYFEYLAEKKDDLLNSQYFDADELIEMQEEEEAQDPEEAKREQKLEIAQNMRDNGRSTREIGDAVGMSQAWVVNYTDPPDPEP